MLTLASATSSGVTAWSTFALAAIAAIALVGTAVGLYQVSKQNRRARAYEYMDRLFSPEFAPLVTRTRTLLLTAQEPKKCWQAPAEKRALAKYRRMTAAQRSEVILVLNFFEGLAGTYKAGLLDKQIVTDMLAPLTLQI